MVALKVAPAVAAGKTVVLKPDENASLSTLEFAHITDGIFPPGVISVVPSFGVEVGAAITSRPGIAKLAFTGSPEVGKLIGHAGAERLIPVSFELDGKSPNIVFPEIEDMDAVVDNALFASMYCNGQSCLAGTRLFIHDDIYAPFIDKLTQAVSRITLGDPMSESTRLSCMINQKQGERVLSYIGVGREEGAKLLIGGQRRDIAGHGHGYFIEPTVFEATNRMRIAQEEIFGPVLSVIRWNDYDAMVEQANGVRYGLASGIYMSNLANAMKTADLLEAGNVWINQYFNLNSGAPFGGEGERDRARALSRHPESILPREVDHCANPGQSALVRTVEDALDARALGGYRPVGGADGIATPWGTKAGLWRRVRSWRRGCSWRREGSWRRAHRMCCRPASLLKGAQALFSTHRMCLDGTTARRSGRMRLP